MRCLQSLLLCKMVSKFSNSKERVDDGVFYTRPHFVGNSILLYGRKNSYFPFHCMIGPHWPLMIFTLLFITLPTYWFLTHIAGKWDSFLLVSCSGSLLLSSFIFTACSDPGIVFISPHQSDIESQSPGAITYAKLNNIKNSKGIPCGKCNIDRPSNAFHCYDCNACMEDLDHHCVVSCVVLLCEYTCRGILCFFVLSLVKCLFPDFHRC